MNTRMGRPATSEERILEELTSIPARAWYGHSELFAAADLTYPAFRSVIFRLRRKGTIETKTGFRGNGSEVVTDETTWYRLR